MTGPFHPLTGQSKASLYSLVAGNKVNSVAGPAFRMQVHLQERSHRLRCVGNCNKHKSEIRGSISSPALFVVHSDNLMSIVSRVDDLRFSKTRLDHLPDP